MRKYLIPVLIAMIVILGGTSLYFYKLYAESKLLLVGDYYKGMSLIGSVPIEDEIYKLENGKWWIKADAAIQYIDTGLYYSGSGKRVYVPLDSADILLESRALTQYLNTNVDVFNIPLHTIDGIRYLDVEMMESIYPIRHSYYENTGVHVLLKGQERLEQGIATDRLVVHDRVDGIQLEVGQVVKNELLTVLSDNGKDAKVITSEGEVGFVKSGEITSRQAVKITNAPIRERVEPKTYDRFRLAWHQIHDYKFYTGTMKYGPEDGLDIISPTWFSLNVDGIILNLADQSYVKAAKDKGLDVWALFSNSFDPDWTHEMLSSLELRKKVIGQLALYASLYDLDGINIDFENVYLDDKALFTEFVAEFAQVLHQQNMTVSIDVTVPWGSERYSLFADREALSKSVDYVMLMAYDEHWASIQTPGSVASRDWVEKGIAESLKLIPKDKLILGIPFYSRVWSQIGNGKVSSKALGFEGQGNWLSSTSAKAVYDSDTGQNYAEAMVEGSRQRIWLEDATSLSMRLQLADKYDLPGIAGWSLLFTTEEVWSQIQSEYPPGGGEQ